MLLIHVIRYGIGYVLISLLQIDSPQAGGHISRATEKFGALRIADCDCVMLESEYVAFVV
jgi:hypothetical protein